MYFEIQASNPSIRRRPADERESLSSAMLAVFPEVTEDAILVWNWLPIRINYNSDLSAMIDDVLPMLTALLESDSGSFITSFGANTFRSRWSLHWISGGALRMEATWHSVAGSYEDLLNSRPIIELQQYEFHREWKAPLKKVIEAIDASGIRIAEQEQLIQLRRVEAAILDYGRIYQHREIG